MWRAATAALLFGFAFLGGLIMDTVLQSLKSRTVWFAIILAALSVLQGYVGLIPNLSTIQQMYVGLAISVAVTVLRFMTTTAVADK
jgi:hypothetical protein